MNEPNDNRSPAREEPNTAMSMSFVQASVVLAVFTLAVLALLLFNSYRLRVSDPWNSNAIQTLKSELHRQPQNEQIKVRIRRLDFNLRSEYLRRLDFERKGAWLLLLGIGGLLFLVPTAAQYRKKITLPEKQCSGEIVNATALSRRAVTVFGLVMLGGFAFLIATSRGNLSAGYVKEVREMEKNPQPLSSAADDNSNPLSGLPPAMLQNLVGRPNASAAPSSGNTPTAVPALPAAGTAPITPLPPLTAKSPTNGTAATPLANTGSPNTSPLPSASLPSLTTHHSPLTTDLGEVAGATPPVGLRKPEAPFDPSDYSPSPEDFAENWPVFRGPASGLATGDFPTKWNGPAGQGVIWKTDIPLPGWNSPVVWGDRIFCTGADQKNRAVYCFDAATGKLLWTLAVQPISPGEPPKVSSDAGYAAASAATDGKRVFAIFPNGDVFACDFAGKLLWSRSLGTPDSMYGYASSLATFRSLLIIQYDQGSPDDGKSALLALQGSSGKIVWSTGRPVGASWASPIVARSGDQGLIITNSTPWAIAYDALSGKELWRANVMSSDVASSPTYADGLAYVCNADAVLAAIRTGGSGDVTKTQIVWQATDGLPDTTSPATDGNLIFLLTTEGMATCYDAKNGTKVWEHDYQTTFKSSPVIVGSRVYLQENNGVMHIIANKRTFEEETTSPLGETVNATPAFVGGRIYIRGEKHLYCISK